MIELVGHLLACAVMISWVVLLFSVNTAENKTVKGWPVAVPFVTSVLLAVWVSAT